MSDALTDGERMTREFLARRAGLGWCSRHYRSYEIKCPSCEDLRRISDKLVGADDGMRKATDLLCVYELSFYAPGKYGYFECRSLGLFSTIEAAKDAHTPGLEWEVVSNALQAHIDRKSGPFLQIVTIPVRHR